MEVFVQIALYASGYLAWMSSGSLLVAFGAAGLFAAALRLAGLRSSQYLALPVLGSLASMYVASGDSIGVAIVLAGLFAHLGSADLGAASVSKRPAIAIGLILAFVGLNSATLSVLILGFMCLSFTLPRLPLTTVSWLRPLSLVTFLLHASVSPFAGLGSSVYIEHGKWATDSGDYGSVETGLLLRNETSYSYSWLSRLVSDRSGTVMSLGPEDGTAWLVTPTKPFSPREVDHLERWVRGGGRLILVSDHTDYLGHARCLNQLASFTGVRAKYASFLPIPRETESVQLVDGSDLLTKTPTAGEFLGATPFASSIGYLEAPDYTRAGFFGPCTPSRDDEFGRHVIGAISGHGLGSVVFWGDSTLFSNFSIFQPSSIRALCALESREYAVLLAAVPGVLFAMALYPATVFWLMLLAASLLSAAHLALPTPEQLMKGHASVAWSGDSNLVDDRYDPKASFSTVYAVSSASGFLPRWTDSPELEDGGIWLSESPPPAPGWRWVSPFLGAKHQKRDASNPWDSLVHLVNPEAVYTVVPPDLENPHSVDAGGFWTNEGVGSWWFGPGTSPARSHKIRSFLVWAKHGQSEWEEPALLRPVGTPVGATLLMDNGSRHALRIPKFSATPGDFVYLGAGVSAIVTEVDGKTLLSGSRDKDCFGYANSAKQSSWVLYYDADVPDGVSK